MSFDYNTASPDEIREEALRRQRGHGAWRGESPMTPAQEKRKEMLLEKDVQARVIKLYVRHGCKVRVYSQPRKAKYMTAGGADLQIVSPVFIANDHWKRVMWYHETKKPKDGRYSDEQLLFAADMREAGISVIGGGVPEAQAQLDKLGLRPL